MADLQGLRVNPDGSQLIVPPVQYIEPGNDLPPGRLENQVGVDGAEEVGLVYRQFSKKTKPGVFNPDEFTICPGDYVVCSTLQQYIQAFAEDLKKSLGENAAISVIPSPDDPATSKVYRGLSGLMSDTHYTVNTISTTTLQTYVTGIVNQGILNEVIQGLGVPLTVAIIEVDDAQGTTRQLPYASIADDGLTITQQLYLHFINLSLAIANSLELA